MAHLFNVRKLNEGISSKRKNKRSSSETLHGRLLGIKDKSIFTVIDIAVAQFLVIWPYYFEFFTDADMFMALNLMEGILQTKHFGNAKPLAYMEPFRVFVAALLGVYRAAQTQWTHIPRVQVAVPSIDVESALVPIPTTIKLGLMVDQIEALGKRRNSVWQVMVSTLAMSTHKRLGMDSDLALLDLELLQLIARMCPR